MYAEADVHDDDEKHLRPRSRFLSASGAARAKHQLDLWSDDDCLYKPMNEKELTILTNINDTSTPLSQRELAHSAGMSLGMTNAVLKRLVTKGWLTMRKVNNRNIRYVVTPTGMEEITRRSYRYFKRTLKNVAEYKDRIEELLTQIHTNGYNSLVLVGSSDIDFIVEYLCSKLELHLIRSDNEITDKTFVLYAESYIPDRAEKKDGVLFLQDVFV